jgi:hypothetical protein
MILRILLTVVLAMLAVNAQSSDSRSPAEQYVCIADQSAGFNYNKQNKAWESRHRKGKDSIQL